MNLLKRGWNLLKAGRAIREIRRSTDEDSRQRARRYLMELLGQSRGLTHKLGQFLAMGSGELSDALAVATPSMSYEEYLECIEQAFGQPHHQIFKSIGREGRPASLGQVHFGRLKDGREVAVKVQYPGISDSVESELKLFGWMPAVGPVSRWGFNLGGYQQTFHDNFTRELDYRNEARQQARYHSLCMDLEDVIVPEVHEDLCCETVLVQVCEEGLSLDSVEGLAPEQRQAFGRAILRHYIHMIFRHGYVHADPNPGNFAFRSGRPEALILYDFGCVIEMSDNVRLALLRTILALRDREPLDPAACLAALGFVMDKLGDLRPALPALLQVLLEPFLLDGPYDTRDWRMSERFDAIVGELKWWFRSAAPPDLIFLMRTLHGLINLLNRLQVALPWYWTLESLCGGLFSEALALELPQVPAGHAPAMFDGLARYLKVDVVKANGNKVNLTLPGRVAERLEEVIDPPVLETIRTQGIDLIAIQRGVLKSGFRPQMLFEVKDAERHVRVWLE